MAISPLWRTRMSVSLFNTLMMELKDVGEIIDRVIFCYGSGMHQLSCIGNLVVVDGNVNQYSSIDLIGGNLLESVEQMFGDQQHPFVL